MNLENKQKLKTDFPKLFEKLPDFEYRIDDGWFNLVYNTCQKIHNIFKDEKDMYPSIMCLKEKFGGLRIYLNDMYNVEIPQNIKNMYSEAYTVILQAEGESYKICEICGKPGKLMLTEHNWIRMICEEHKKEDYKDYTGGI